MTTAQTQLSVIDGLTFEVTVDGNQTVMKLVEDPVKIKSGKPWYSKVLDWFRKSDMTPYARSKDLSDPFDERKNDPFDDGSGSASSVEIGVRIKF